MIPAASMDGAMEPASLPFWVAGVAEPAAAELVAAARPPAAAVVLRVAELTVATDELLPDAAGALEADAAGVLGAATAAGVVLLAALELSLIHI